MSNSSETYTGPWVNHSHGVVLGATITLTTRNAAFLLALLAIIVTTAGHSIWRIVSYILHQTRSNTSQHDVIFYQEQAILKNSGGALDAAWKFSRAFFAWRKHKQSRTSRSLAFIVMGLALAALFSVASIFSSQVTRAAGDEFLINSDNCGFWELDFNVTSSADLYKITEKSQSDIIEAATYATNCYGRSKTDAAQCNTYMIPEIPWTANQNASCPFAPENCLLSPTAAYEMDTGILDSHHDLGINSRSFERIGVRKMAICAPIHIAPYVVFYNLTAGDGNVDVFAGLQLGDPNNTGENITVAYDTHLQYMSIGYSLQAITTHSSSPGSSGANAIWNPIAAFNRSDADITMFFFAANRVVNTYNNSDPIFSANNPFDAGDDLFGKDRVVYIADKELTALGCTDQYQICNPNIPGQSGEPMLCTPLVGLYSLTGNLFSLQLEEIGLNLYQMSTAETLVFAFGESSMWNSVSGRGSSALQAQKTMVTTVSGYAQEAQLPNNQWQIELSSWFNISLANLQQYLVQKASGPTGVLNEDGSIRELGIKSDEAICKRQMIRNVAGYQNFSTLGVAIILVFGSGLVLLGLVIDTIAGLVQKRFLKRDYQRLSWVSDGYLQLQRLAYEGAGYEGWDGCADEVPVSKSVEEQVPELRGLDDSDLDHPRLFQHAKTGESSGVKSSTEDTKQGALVSQENV